MSRKRVSNIGSTLRNLLGLFRGRSRRKALTHQTLRRLHRFETLEHRSMLAADLGSIAGFVYQDLDGDGYEVSEAVNNATINLYLDDGDGIFEPGVGAGLDGAAIGTTNADANGNYQFNGLAAGNYWVEQPSQPGNVGTLSQIVRAVTISATQASQGSQATLIDDFDTVSALITDGVPVNGTPATGTVDNAGILGGELDLAALLTTGPGPTDNVSIQSGGGITSLGSSSGGAGTYTLTWDGNDGDAATLDATGLGGVDLTANDGLAFRLAVSAFDQSGGSARIRVYTDGGNWSESPIINIPANVAQDLSARYDSFLVGAGAGADFTNVGAIQLEIFGVAAMDGQIGLVSAVGEAVVTQDFGNQVADLSLTKTVDNATPDMNDLITFTITVENAGTAAATGVAVLDLLPAGISFSSATPSQGTYDAGTGIWTVGTIAALDNATLQIEATVTSIGTKTNTAQVSAADQIDSDSTPGNSVASEDDQDSVDVTPQVADLSVTKVVDNSTPNLGEDVTFTITLANDGPDDATNVTLTDLLPAGLTLVTATPSVGTYDNVTGIWTVGSVASSDSETLTIVATVATFGVKTNIAQVTAADQFDSDSTPNNSVSTEDDQASAIVTPLQIDLSLTKTVDDATPDRDQDITFTITVSNAGPDAATGVFVTDLLPPGLTFMSANPSQGTYDAPSGVWSVGTVNGTDSETLEIVARVTTSGIKTNTAQVAAADQADPDSTPNNDVASEDDQASVDVTPNMADLSLTKTVDDDTPAVGTDVTFTITVANAGPVTATNVAITDLLPAGLTFVSANSSVGTYNEATGIWTVGSVANGDSETLTILATATTAGLQTNTAEITAADQFDPDSTPNNANAAEDDQASAAVTASPQIDLSLTKTVDDATPDRNQNVTFTVTLNNAGPSAAANVAVSDQLPAGLTLVSATPSVGSYSNATGIWTVGTVNSGASATLTIVATVTTSGVKTNTAQVSAADGTDSDSTPGNNVASEDDQASVSVTPNVSDLSLTKTVNNASPNPGQNVTFTLTLNNARPQAATGVNVLDQLPAGLTFVSATPSVGTYSNATGIWNVGTLNSGATATLQIVVTVVGSASFTNTAQVSTSDTFDLDSTPGNSIASEDDQSSVTLNSRRLSKRLYLAR